jgi:hypothetical protein
LRAVLHRQIVVLGGPMISQDMIGRSVGGASKHNFHPERGSLSVKLCG